MIIKKLAHCCFTITTDTATIITDPGSFVTPQDMVHADILLLSHEHGDHYIPENIHKLIELNPDLAIYTTDTCHSLLQDEGIDSTIMRDGDTLEHQGVSLGAAGEWHEEIYGEKGMCKNLGFWIDDKVFFTGDAFQNLDHAPQVLLFCLAGPFTRLRQSIDYAKASGARAVIPMHESILLAPLQEFYFSVADHAFSQEEMQFIPLISGGEYTHVAHTG